MAKELEAVAGDPEVFGSLHNIRSGGDPKNGGWNIHGKTPAAATDDDVRDAIGIAGCLPDQSLDRAPEFVVTVSCQGVLYEVVRIVGAVPLSAEQRAARTAKVAFLESSGVRVEVRPQVNSGATVEMSRTLLLRILGVEVPPGSPSPSF